MFCALKIGIDYDVSYGKRVDMNVYTEIIRRMNQLGFRVNNSFVHVYKKKKESMSIDGVMWGHCSLQEKVAADRFIVHHLCEFNNHIMDVYCANSIQNSALNDKDLSKIREIVGEENVRLVDDSLVFSLPNMVKHTVLYRIKYSFIIQRLRAVFHL